MDQNRALADFRSTTPESESADEFAERYLGSDVALDDMLDARDETFFACTRTWSAWSFGTMTQDDFTPAIETELRADLLAWRDAAVAKALAEHVARDTEG